jgi:hypothetical protein
MRCYHHNSMLPQPIWYPMGRKLVGYRFDNITIDFKEIIAYTDKYGLKRTIRYLKQLKGHLVIDK